MPAIQIFFSKLPTINTKSTKLFVFFLLKILLRIENCCPPKKYQKVTESKRNKVETIF